MDIFGALLFCLSQIILIIGLGLFITEEKQAGKALLSHDC